MATISDIPVGKVGQVGQWTVSRWGKDEFDAYIPMKTKGSFLRDGAPINTSHRFGLTLAQVAQLTGGQL